MNFAKGVPQSDAIPSRAEEEIAPVKRTASSLTVRSTPSGASLLVNGRLVGATPITLTDVPLGAYGLRLEKEGCSPEWVNVALGDSDALVERKLNAVASGALVVEVLPEGSEVLLDGELLGHTPLRLPHVAVGNYELRIHKTNRESYSKQLQVEAGETQTFAGFELKDKVLTMLQSLIQASPQRVAHYIELGDYLFIERKIDEAVDAYIQGMEVLRTPLNFDGPGYLGKMQMSLVEMQSEMCRRKEDEERFPKELDKYRNWPSVDTRIFRKKLDESEDLLNRKNITVWAWVDRAAKIHIQNRAYDRAAKIYEDHIAAVKNSPELFNAYTGLVEVYLIQQNVPKIQELFDKLFEKWKADGNALRTIGKALFSFQDRIVGKKYKEQALGMAEKSLKAASEALLDPAAKTMTLFDLACVLVLLNRSAEAIPYFEATVAAADEVIVREDRQLRLADALCKAGKPEHASALYKTLAASNRASVRDAVQVAMTAMEIEEKKNVLERKK